MSLVILKCPDCGSLVAFWSSIGFCRCSRILMLIDSTKPGKVVIVK